MITAWYHTEEEEDETLFLKPDICEEWVPQLKSVGKKKKKRNVPAMCALFEINAT